MAANFASFMEFCSSIYLVYYGVLAFTFASFMETVASFMELSFGLTNDYCQQEMEAACQLMVTQRFKCKQKKCVARWLIKVIFLKIK